MMTAPAAARRHENRLLAGLPPFELASLARHLHVVSFGSGIALHRQGGPLDFAYFPHDGLISLLATTSTGETIEVASAGRGGAICPMPASELHDGFCLTAAPAGMRASRIAVATLQALLAENEALNQAVEACRESFLLHLRQNLVCGGLHPVEKRLARWLLEVADRLETDSIPIPATQEEVAQRLGVRRTTVTLLASRLQNIGAIRWGRSRVEILDRALLENAACTCYGTLRERLGRLSRVDTAHRATAPAE